MVQKSSQQPMFFTKHLTKKCRRWRKKIEKYTIIWLYLFYNFINFKQNISKYNSFKSATHDGFQCVL